MLVERVWEGLQLVELGEVMDRRLPDSGRKVVIWDVDACVSHARSEPRWLADVCRVCVCMIVHSYTVGSSWVRFSALPGVPWTKSDTLCSDCCIGTHLRLQNKRWNRAHCTIRSGQGACLIMTASPPSLYLHCHG